MYINLPIIMQMVHDVRNTLKYYWSTVEHFFTPLYSKTIFFITYIGLSTLQ